MQYKQRQVRCETAAQPEKQELGEKKGEKQHKEEFLSLRFLINPFQRSQ